MRIDRFAKIERVIVKILLLPYFLRFKRAIIIYIFFFCSPFACNSMLLTWRIVEIGKVIGRSCAPVFRRIYRVLCAIFVSNRFSTILDAIRRRRLGRGVTVGSRINRKKKNNTRLVMFAIQYPFLHSFFIFYFYSFFYFFIFLFFYAPLYSFPLFPSFTHARVIEFGDRRSKSFVCETDRSNARFWLIEIGEKEKSKEKCTLGQEKKRKKKKKGDDE